MDEQCECVAFLSVMEQCACVERELEKVLHRFMTYSHQSEERLDELLRNVCELRSQLVAFGKGYSSLEWVHNKSSYNYIGPH